MRNKPHIVRTFGLFCDYSHCLQEGDNLLAAAAIGGNSELVHWLMEHCGMTPGLDYVCIMIANIEFP